MTLNYSSWGRYPRVQQSAHPVYWRDAHIPWETLGGSVLPRGLGRSYGDVCLNASGVLLTARNLDKWIAFDERTGLLRCEAGVSLAEILREFVPRGWFPPVTPGTKFVTVGGAIANDVHGKNHHLAGTFGCHVRRFELLRSDGERLLCSPESNRDLFRATIGGLGLTGLILWADVQLKPVRGRRLDVEHIRFRNLEEFFALSKDSDANAEYTVAWVDCVRTGRSLGRGIFMRGNHCQEPDPAHAHPKAAIPVPFEMPEGLLNPLSVRAFNTAYYHRQLARVAKKKLDYEPFFYPLDALLDWNRLYGRSGFLQYQFVVPSESDHQAVRSIFEKIARSGQASFLAVLKTFGGVASPGMMSFPRPGVTLALDFAYRGPKTLALLEELDSIVLSEGGAVNPSKDARMSPRMFQQSFPQWASFRKYVDPRFSSSFWRRVTGGGNA